MAEIQRVQHVSVPMPTGGHDAARSFYAGVLGLPEVTPPSTLGHLQLVWFRMACGQEIHCFGDAQPEPNHPAQHLCLEVDDLDTVLDQVRGHGVAVEETISITNRPRAMIRDPFGNLIELTQITGEYD